jgi:DNA-binding transcriptional ArsR family regulator
MKVLNQVGIVKTIRVGTWSHYRLNPEFITLIQPFISAFATEDLHDETAACKP